LGLARYGVPGSFDYHGIVKSFQDNGFTVISDIRSSDVEPSFYAKKVAKQVTTLLDAGIPPNSISVAGHSKGGYITLHVSTILQNPRINFVVMAGCDISHYGRAPQPIHGRFLSIFDASDAVAGSCQGDFARTLGEIKTKEMVLKTGKGHDLFDLPNKEWFDPVVDWIKQSQP